MKKICLTALITGLGIICPRAAETSAEASPQKSVPFEEVQKLIREHLADASDEELNNAAVTGLIEQLKPHVALGHAGINPDSTNAPVAKTARFRQDFGYLKVDAVRDGLRAELRKGIDELLREGPLRGVVIDLRFAGGTDYHAAVGAAALFTESHDDLLKIGDEVQKAEPSDEPILIPVMALTNGKTAGAGEALAAALRYLKAGLVIGGRTAGEAMLFEEFPLSNGEVLRVASRSVQLGDGKSIPRVGLTPDIVVESSLADDQRYLTDPYWAPESGETDSTGPRRRITEADLVRQRREGIPLQQIISNAVDRATTPKLVSDPALGRALDMLKALSVVQTWKKAE